METNEAMKKKRERMEKKRMENGEGGRKRIEGYEK